METFDPEKAARVWKRVRAEAAPSPAPAPAEPSVPSIQGLLPLIASEWRDATTYLSLSRRFQGRASESLRQMAQQEQTHAACLKGIYALTAGARPVTPAVSPEQESTEAILRQCYSREMRSIAEYEARSSDPEYGQVFARMAAQERDHCRRILEILGSLKR